MEDIILVGYGGHARSVADCVERMEKYRIVGYTDTEPYDSKYIYLGTDEYLEKYRSDGIENVVKAEKGTKYFRQMIRDCVADSLNGAENVSK